MDWLNHLKQPQSWLLGLAIALIALHLTLLNRINESDLLATSVLFWLAAGSLIWDRRQTLPYKSGVFATAFGATLLALIIFRSAFLRDGSTFLKVLPFISMFSLCLLASGFRNLRQYWKELLIFGLLAVNPVLELMLQLVNLPLWTAKVATFMLWYSGVQVRLQGVSLLLSNGRVDVYGACSGLHSVLQMLSIAVLFLLLVPVRPWQKIPLCIGTGICIGFFVNAVRVALMAILFNLSQKSAFDYWHVGDGSLVFSVISVLLFGVFCWFAFLRTPPQKPDSGAPTHV